MEGLQKVVNLIKKTGDKAIILDQSGEPSYVIMTLPDYERLILGKSEVIGLTEGELLDKINREIAIWKENKAEEEEDTIRIEEIDFSRDLEEYQNLANFSDFNRVNKESSLAEIYNQLSTNEEEDRYYFEPVE